MGGHCLPVDPFYLAWKAREYDFYTEFIELAGKINQNMPYFCVDKIERTLNSQGKAVHGSRIVLLGVAYKPGVADLRQSPGAEDPEAARRRAARTWPTTTRTCRTCRRRACRPRRSDELLEGADLVVIVTAHKEIDYRRVVAESPLVLDFRGVTREIQSANLVRL